MKHTSLAVLLLSLSNLKHTVNMPLLMLNRNACRALQRVCFREEGKAAQQAESQQAESVEQKVETTVTQTTKHGELVGAFVADAHDGHDASGFFSKLNT